jgi:hypothetical protein
MPIVIISLALKVEGGRKRKTISSSEPSLVDIIPMIPRPYSGSLIET